MKKIVFIPLAAALIVSGCNTAPQQSSQPAQPSEPPVSSSSSQSQPALKPSEQPALDLHAHYNVPQSVEIIDHVEGRSELPYNYVSLEFLKRFLSALTAGDWQSAADIASDVDGVFDCFASVVITDAEITQLKMAVPVSRGGRWVYSVITESEFDPNTKQYTITFDLYSDTICWVVGKTVQYKLSENEDGSFRLLSVEVLYDSGINIQVGSI